jgi:phage tail-like protein
MVEEIQEKNPRGTKRIDPYSTFNFRVEIGSILMGGFSEVSGLRVETEVYSIKEGGMNAFEHKLPKSTKFSDITLKRGITDMEMYDWYKEVINGNIERKSGSIILYERGRQKEMRWDFVDAYPVKWEGATFSASGNAIATETLVLTHNGFKLILRPI